jgi:PAS domain S-box-containing protein
LKDTIKVLLVDDDEDDYILTSDSLKEIPNKKFNIDWSSNYKQALEHLKKREHDIYIVDYLLGAKTGIDLLKEAKNLGIAAPFIILTGQGDRAVDVKAMEAGAADYLVKGEMDTNKLERSIRYAMDRAEAVKRIKESEEKYKNIFERTRDMIYITDEDGNFIAVNDSCLRIFGYTREELLKMNSKELYADAEDRKLFMEVINLTGEITDYEVILKTKTGEKRYCLLSTFIHSAGEEKKIYQGIIHDITKRRKAEQSLATVEKLVVTGKVARMLAHEVRNPLTNINLAVEQLNTESPPSRDAEEYFKIISRNSDRINQIITELLNSSRPAQLTFAKHSINRLVDEALELAQDRISLKGIKVIKEYSPHLCDATVDAEKIKIAILNIIVNAIEAMKDHDGILTVVTKGEGGKCLVIIEDNGTGISKNVIPKIFDPFFSEKSKGTGLGLSVTHNIVVTHKGTIDVESEPGKGTRFTLAFNFD